MRLFHVEHLRLSKFDSGIQNAASNRPGTALDWDSSLYSARIGSNLPLLLPGMTPFRQLQVHNG